MTKMPVLFVGHGSPMNALDKNPFTEGLHQLAGKIPRPQAILAVSAHWETTGTQILSAANPQTIHDFYGFPKALFDIRYPAPGAPELAAETQKLVGGDAILTEKWGYDHGTWSILLHMYPEANIPVYQLSLDVKKDPKAHVEIGRKLQALREKGVLILGSGNIVHNLRLINWKDQKAVYPWAKEFDLKVKAALENREDYKLMYLDENQEADRLSVPSADHYLPLLYCYGASTPEDSISYPYEGYELGSLSMRSVLWK
ncbi:4,5-DOPA dioxygenase extradiol [Bdellovibrio reynosensis]|uniref:4,5-DOPA dioxygenase extradiol n=2 Tax=Bdellovibrio reynosensis TaxID=2835041 RepID=A0ABY4CGY5_9BACT|nr:4,5-DOPA dioxygenase extradiol [Bdellovibrio reynosensis]UOF02833.1 4,5-DOPA dioxygenase extradiol [Bdellovibrio reynosensis]